MEEQKGKLLKKYENLPKVIRWIIFLPISFLFSIIITFAMRSAAQQVGGWGIVDDIFHPVFAQIVFLYGIYYTIPKWKVRGVTFFVIVRTLVLLALIILPILVFIRDGYFHDWELIKDAIGEILTLVASLYLVKEIKSKEQNKFK